MENLMRIREPLAWTMVVLSALMLAYQAIQITWYLIASVEWYPVGDSVRPPLSISWIFGWQGVDYALMLALFVAVAGCWFAPVIQRARTIALVAAWVTTVTVAMPWVVIALTLLVSPASALNTMGPWEWWMPLGLLHPLITTGVGVVAAVALWALARRPAGPEESEDESDAEAGPAEPDAEKPTVWKPAEATGTVWRTADEAASGAPGSRSLESGTTGSAGAERSGDAPRPEPATGEEWRPPSGR